MPPSTPDQSGLRALWKPEQGMTPCNPSGGDVAIFHASVKTFSRGRGQSAVAAAAYRAGVQLHDELGGKTQDYRSRSGVLASFIVLPNNAPSWMADRAMLWNMAEWREKRKDSVLARELEVALPHELTPAARERLVRNMAQWLIDRYGVAVDAAIHTPERAGDDRNHHAHIMFTTRAVIPEGFGDKTRILDTKKTGSAEVQDIRQAWQDLANAELAAAGARARIDRRSHAEKGLDVPPQIHVGVNAVGMARRGVEPSGSNVIAYKGREVDYAPIDMGGTRAQHNAEIIELQKYRNLKPPPNRWRVSRRRSTIYPSASRSWAQHSTVAYCRMICA
jgi:MobA/MobL family.